MSLLTSSLKTFFPPFDTSSLNAVQNGMFALNFLLNRFCVFQRFEKAPPSFLPRPSLPLLLQHPLSQKRVTDVRKLFAEEWNCFFFKTRESPLWSHSRVGTKRQFVVKYKLLIKHWHTPARTSGEERGSQSLYYFYELGKFSQAKWSIVYTLNFLSSFASSSHTHFWSVAADSAESRHTVWSCQWCSVYHS